MRAVVTTLACAAVLACQPPPSPAPVVAPTQPSAQAGGGGATVSPSSDAVRAVADAAAPSASLGGQAPAPSDAPADARFRACASDADCVAVARVGCCHNGWLEAVAASQRAAYAASFVCPTPHPICAMFIIRDQRVARCDAAAKLCVMVDP